MVSGILQIPPNELTLAPTRTQLNTFLLLLYFALQPGDTLGKNSKQFTAKYYVRHYQP